MVTATVAMIIAAILGVPLAWLLARPGLRGASLLRALITIPLVLPPVVGGVALFTVLGRSGLLGRPLYQLTGFAFPFTPYAVILAQVFVALPFLVLSVEGALRAADRRVTRRPPQPSGRGRVTVFRRIHLAPHRDPASRLAAVLAWARALGEFGATITFAGNFPGTDAHYAAGGLSRAGNRSWVGAVALGAVARSLGRRTGLASGSMGEPVVAELSAELGVRRGDFTLDLGLQIAAGEVVALLGPNGAGKSTALRALAGLLQLTSGEITIAGRVAADPVSGLHRAPHERPIGVVFQDYLLFPHLTVLDNVAFGPLVRGPG